MGTENWVVALNPNEGRFPDTVQVAWSQRSSLPHPSAPICRANRREGGEIAAGEPGTPGLGRTRGPQGMGRALSLGQGETQRFGSPEPPCSPSREGGRVRESHLPTGVEDLTI